jgi:hypothetical protein
MNSILRRSQTGCLVVLRTLTILYVMSCIRWQNLNKLWRVSSITRSFSRNSVFFKCHRFIDRRNVLFSYLKSMFSNASAARAAGNFSQVYSKEWPTVKVLCLSQLETSQFFYHSRATGSAHWYRMRHRNWILCCLRDRVFCIFDGMEYCHISYMMSHTQKDTGLFLVLSCLCVCVSCKVRLSFYPKFNSHYKGQRFGSPRDPRCDPRQFYVLYIAKKATLV